MALLEEIGADFEVSKARPFVVPPVCGSGNLGYFSAPAFLLHAAYRDGHGLTLLNQDPWIKCFLYKLP